MSAASTAPGVARPRRVRARVEGTVQGVGFRPYVFRLATELGLGGCVLNDERGVLLEVEGRPEQIECVPRPPASPKQPPLAAIEAVRRAHAVADGRARFPDPRLRRRRRARGPGRARHGDLRRLPRGALRPGRPPLPLSVHQLHQLRAAVDDHPRRPLRPAADDDGGVRDVRRLAAPSTRIRATAASTRSRTPVRMRAAASGCSTPTASDRGGRPDPIEAAAALLPRGLGRRGQGTRRLPPRLRRRRRARRRRAPGAQAPRAEAVRADGARPRAARELVELSPTEEELLDRAAAPDRDRPPARAAPASRPRWRRALATSA